MGEGVGWLQGTSKKTYNPMKLAPLVTLGPTQVILVLSRAELTEVFGGARDNVLEELESYAA